MSVVHPIRKPETGVRLEAATASFLAEVDLADSTLEVYTDTLRRLVAGLGDVELTEVTRVDIAEHLAAEYAEVAPATYNRVLATISSLFSWAVDTDLLVVSPTKGLRRKRPKVTVEAERQARPIPYAELETLWSDTSHSLRDRVFWALAYDTAARASELLGLDVERVDPANREAVIIGKGGNAERIFWSSITARLLPRLLAGRSMGPLFLTERRPRAHVAPASTDVCPTTGRARLSYRRAEEIWKDASGGYTLHQLRDSRLTHLSEAGEDVTMIKAKSRHRSLRSLQLRHSRLTHLSEAGEDVTMIKAKSRHRSLRSLERYVNPSAGAIRDLTNRHDPNRRT